MGVTNKTIRLRRWELEYLKSAQFLEASLAQILESAQFSSEDACSLVVSPSIANQFRSAFTDRVAEVGFDDDYELTSEGKVLEELIDRFFPG